MLRLASVVRSTRRYIPASVPRRRYESTVTKSGTHPLTKGESSSPPGGLPEEVETHSTPTIEQIDQLSAAPRTTPTVKNGEPRNELAGQAPTSSISARQALGLKYDPAELPLTEPLDPRVEDFSEEQYAASVIHGRSVHLPYFHPRTHDIPVANIHFRSHHIKLLNLFTHFASHAAASLGIPISRVVPLPTQRSLWTVPRSPFVHKKSQENFDRKVYKRAIKAWDADPEVVERWVTYLRAHALGGVGMRVTTWERLPLGVGSSAVLAVRDNSGKNTSAEAPGRIRRLGEKIIQKEVSRV